MNSLRLSLTEVAVLHSARKAAPKHVVVQRALDLAEGSTFDDPVARVTIDRLYADRLLSKNELGEYEMTDRGLHAVSEAVARIDSLLSTVRYGAKP